MSKLFRYLIFIAIAASLLFLIKKSLSTVSISRRKRTPANASELDLRSANLLVQQMYGQVDYYDERLAVLNYTIVPRSGICDHVHYLVIVIVSASDTETRQRWRNTYGQFQDKFNYSIVFAIGLSQNESFKDALNYEATTYGDMLQADFSDTYRNLTLKVKCDANYIKAMAALRYAAVTCTDVQGIVKLDDDVAWNMKAMKSVVDMSAKDDKMRCFLMAPYEVQRNPKNKWQHNYQTHFILIQLPTNFTIAILFLSSEVDGRFQRYVTKEEFGATRYPLHCYGLVSIISRPALLRLLAVVNKERFFWIDDVFLTGILTKRSGVQLSSISKDISLYGKPIGHSYWFSSSTFTLTYRDEIEKFFVITNAEWFFEEYIRNEKSHKWFRFF